MSSALEDGWTPFKTDAELTAREEQWIPVDELWSSYEVRTLLDAKPDWIQL